MHQLLVCCGMSGEKTWFVVSVVDCSMGKVEFVVDGSDFQFLSASELLTVGDDCMRSGSFTIVR